jgi:predicted dienelactone hydrolase
MIVPLNSYSFKEENMTTLDLQRRFTLQAALASGLALQLAPHAFAQALPAPLSEIWTDAARSRDVPVLLRWPQGKPLGVVVHSHGLGGKKEGGDVWGQAWASAGFLVVHVQHPGSDAPALKGGFAALREASKPQQLVARMQDVRFAVAQMQRRRAAGEGAWSSLPLEKLAVSGHSFGARTTLLSAGWQRNGVNGTEPLAKAFIALSPALGQNPSIEQARLELASATRPMLICTGSQDGEIMGNGETSESRRMVFDALPAGKKALLWLDQADHFTFAGNEKQVPSTFLAKRSKESLGAEDQHHQVIAKVTTAWLQEHLLGQMMQSPGGLTAKDQWLRA